MMNHYWARTIRGRLFKRGIVISILLAVACGLSAQSLGSLVEAHRTKPTGRTAAALYSFAKARAADPEGALALLVLGAEAGKDETPSSESTAWLETAKARLPDLADFAAYHLAVVYSKTERHAEAIGELEFVLNFQPPSPWRAQAVLLAARVYLDSKDAAPAVGLLREHMANLPQPEGLGLLARCQESSGQLGAAADSWQRVYHRYPMTAESRDALAAMARLRRRLGRDYPPVTSQLMLERVETLIRRNEHLTARRELQEMTLSLGGRDRDLARVWLGKARHIRRHDDVAFRWLQPLRVVDPEVDAERLYWLLESARRLNRRSEIERIIEVFAERYPTSEWRLKALVSAGNMYLLTNNQERYVPLYRACAESFPVHERAPYCDWKVAWSAYINRRPESGEMLRKHIEDFPASPQAPAALYFLGRLAEGEGDRAAAAAWYREVDHEYPNYYYAYRARERLATANLDGDGCPDVHRFLEGVNFPQRRHAKNFEPTPITSQRLARAQALLSAGILPWGEMELRYGARTGAQGPILAVVLSEASAKVGDYGKSIRYIKGLAPGYLSMPLEAAPDSFWKLAFPLAYRDVLAKYSAQRKLDLYFLAALIRQESEFDHRAVSRARAYGLTQVLPATGRQLARTLRVRNFSTRVLYDPEVNVNMGTYYLRHMIDGLDGHTEAALAAYNAGRSRALIWLTWGEFREPSEFIETIPFTETRNYVQTVLRNADIYRQLYQ